MKRATAVSLQADIDEMNEYLINQNEQVRSAFEIELLKGELRDLVNEKAKLEIQISSREFFKLKCNVEVIQKFKIFFQLQSVISILFTLSIPLESNWQCNTCTFSNTSDSLACAMCGTEREGKFHICIQKQIKNSLTFSATNL